MRIVMMGSSARSGCSLSTAIAAVLAKEAGTILICPENPSPTFEIKAQRDLGIDLDRWSHPLGEEVVSAIQYGPVRKGKGGKPLRW